MWDLIVSFLIIAYLFTLWGFLLPLSETQSNKVGLEDQQLSYNPNHLVLHKNNSQTNRNALISVPVKIVMTILQRCLVPSIISVVRLDCAKYYFYASASKGAISTI